jgi:hypothetical protein
MPRQKKKTTIDYDDEEAVLADVAAALEADIEECVIDEDRGMSSFGEGTVYQVDWGVEEYHVAESYDQAEKLAVAVVKQDLEQEPEIFNKDFIERHINTDRLRKDLYHDVFDMTFEDLGEMSEKELVRVAELYGVDQPEEGDNEFEWDLEELADKITEEKLQDPMQYLEDIYGDDAAAKAIEIAGIDIDAAADDAVDTDGWEHFLARYDGNSHETASGLVFWRVN